MSKANELIDQLLDSTNNRERRWPLAQEFRALPDVEKQSVEARLIQLLPQDDIDEGIRPWIPDFLGNVGTPAAFQAMLKQLSIDKSYYVRSWIARYLIQYGREEQYVKAALEQFGRETAWTTRRYFSLTLAKADDPILIPTFIEWLDDDDYMVRRRGAYGLRRIKAKEGVEPLVKRLRVEKVLNKGEEQEDSLLVSSEIIGALVAINDPRAIPTLLKVLQDRERPTQLYLDILQALEQLPDADDEEVINTLLEVICYPDRIVALTATDTLQTLLAPEQAARRLAEFGLKQTDPQRLSQVADALRLIGGMEIIGFLQSVRGDTKEEGRAQALLEQIGGRQALNVLVDRRMSALAQAQGRVKEFDEQALKIFTETIGQAKRGFMISLVMSGLVFAVGIFLLVGSASILFWGTPDRAQMVIGVLGGLTGIGSVLFMFYRDPLGRIERAVSNLVQTEVAFLGYIRQVTQITAMFEREYLDNENFGAKELQKLLGYTDRTMKETMPLINRYTAQSANKADNLISTDDTKS